MLDENVLKESSNCNFQALSIKARHLTFENNSLRNTIKDLESQLSSLRIVNQELAKNNPKTVQIIIDQLSKQNINLENALFRLIKTNEELSCDILMKSQLITQNQHEFRQILADYQNKIYDLRISIQTKQSYITSLEQKMNHGKEELYNIPSRSYLSTFNELHQTKLLLERHIIENAQLRLMALENKEELNKLIQRLALCESLLKEKDEWNVYQKSSQQTSYSQEQKSKSATKNSTRIQQMLLRFQAKYKNITFAWRNNRKNDLAHQIYQLKMFISSMYRDVWKYGLEKKRLEKIVENRHNQNKELRLAYGKMQKEMMMAKVQAQFYRQHFKELSKAPRERKIDFYRWYCPHIQTLIDQSLTSKHKMAQFWKHWYNLILEKWDLIERRMLKKKTKQPKGIRRSNSCPVRINYTQKKEAKSIRNEMRQQIIVSFINEEHEANTLLGYTFQEQLNSKEANFFQQEEEISIIMKPSKTKDKTCQFSKKEIVFEQL